MKEIKFSINNNRYKFNCEPLSNGQIGHKITVKKHKIQTTYPQDK
uniref:Uncharacterized protein n=1 Tax=Rhizophora mucronata TaxID=61149 RepID=A0A2P2PWX4_RHIMU